MLIFAICKQYKNHYSKSMETTKEIYEAPSCTVVQIEAAQVICVSGQDTHEGFQEDEVYHW